MENVKFRRYTIGEAEKTSIQREQSRMERFFLRLPYFQPWVWKTIAIAGAVGFLIGIGIGEWADMPITK